MAMEPLPQDRDKHGFLPINPGYDRVFVAGDMSIGLVVPIESYQTRTAPTLERHIERVQLAERLGFSAVWLRDVPFDVPTFGDAGQMLDPFVYLGALAVATQNIALGVASVILPLRHPAHVAKAASSVDVLSSGRLILGIASGDRPEEYPALGASYIDRGQRFRESYEYIRQMATHGPAFESRYGHLDGTIDMLPKPVAGRLPLLVTGASQQSPEWLATNADGWMTYPRPALAQSRMIDEFRHRIASAGFADKPVLEPLYVDLLDDPDAPPQPIHLGLRLGVRALVAYLRERQSIGVNHVAINLRFNGRDIERTLRSIADHVLPNFSNKETP